MADQNPALKIPPITSQEDSVIIKTIAGNKNVESFFIILFAYLCKSFAACFSKQYAVLIMQSETLLSTAYYLLPTLFLANAIC
jgi:hypothetical protein